MNPTMYIALVCFMVCIGGIYGELPTTKVSLEEYEDSTVPSKDDIEEETFQFDNDEEVSEQFYGNPSGFRLVLRRGQSDYANCAGDYKIALQTKVRGRPIYYNKGKQRIIFYNGSKYVITSYYYWKQVLIGGATGGFYSSRNGYYSNYLSYWTWYPRYYIIRL